MPFSPRQGVLVLLAAIVCTIVNGGIIYTFGIFFKPVITDLGWSRGELSAVNTVFLLGYAPGAIWLGRLSDRRGTTLPLAGAAVLIAGGLALNSQANTLALFFLNYALVGFGTGATLAVPAAIIQRRFTTRRATMLGVVVAGVGVGALIFSFASNQLIAHFGWRDSYLYLALIFGGLLALSVLLFSASSRLRGPAGLGRAAAPAPDLTFAEARRTRVFWLLLGISVLSSAPLLLVLVHLPPYATDQGISAATASGAVGAIGAASTTGRLLMGPVGDWIGWRRLFALSSFACALTVVLLLKLGGAGTLYAFVVLYGFFYGVQLTQLMGGVAASFGTAHLGAMLGVTLGISTVAAASSPLLAGYLFDVSGSYTISWGFAMACSAAAGAGALLLRARE